MAGQIEINIPQFFIFNGTFKEYLQTNPELPRGAAAPKWLPLQSNAHQATTGVSSGGTFIPFPQERVQTTQWGHSSLCRLICWRRIENPRLRHSNMVFRIWRSRVPSILPPSRPAPSPVLKHLLLPQQTSPPPGALALLCVWRASGWCWAQHGLALS